MAAQISGGGAGEADSEARAVEVQDRVAAGSEVRAVEAQIRVAAQVGLPA